MTRIAFERRLQVPIDRAWQMLTDPVHMNRWSVAPVEGCDAQRSGGARIVHVRKFGISLTLEEQVVEARPPVCFHYRVRPNWVVRRHGAVQRLTAVGSSATDLEWSVDIRSWIPGMMPLLVWSMRGQLERSLDALVAVAADEAH